PTAVSYEWTPIAGGSFDGGAENPRGFLTETTIFTVVVTDAEGCTASDSVLVTVLPSVEISSGFTPNNDGVNDRWIIDNIELFPESLVSIFNRWGQLLYRQRSYNMGNAWDGTYEGSALPIGTYYYTIELNDPRFPEPFTGPITIYR
ncbi:MAG: gliding motility-associated C-terminal domain-containing protein, partial [Cryomorphaceae bacterium]